MTGLFFRNIKKLLIELVFKIEKRVLGKKDGGIFNKNKLFFPQLLFPLSLLFPTTNMKVWLFPFKKRKTFTVQKRKREKKVKMLAIKMDRIKAPALKKFMFIGNFRYIQVHGVWPTKAEGLWNSK